MSARVSIPGRFNGPLDSGNGGYCAGVVAGLVEGPAEVSLRSPVPLDTPLDVIRGDDGTAQVMDGETLVAEARPAAAVDLEVPEPVAPNAAREAMRGYRGLTTGPFCRCFVCGPAREDSERVFAGRVGSRRVVATTWTPSAAVAVGNAPAELVWAVLDCPTYFATYVDEDLALSFLARFAVRIDGPVALGKEHVVMAWPVAVDGRKRRAGAAVLTGDGEVLAVADALLIEPRA